VQALRPSVGLERGVEAVEQRPKRVPVLEEGVAAAADRADIEVLVAVRVGVASGGTSLTAPPVARTDRYGVMPSSSPRARGSPSSRVRCVARPFETSGSGSLPT
jgi:hypothetical protein